MFLPVLNLLNFELPVASRSQYVLTSPRSLKACRKAGIKPIELLYKSLTEVESEVVNIEDATALFEAYEEERQRKLAICRFLRNELLLNGDWSEEPNEFLPENNRSILKLHNEDHRQSLTPPDVTPRKEDTLENRRKPKLHPDSPKTAMSLPKVNVVFDRYTTKSEVNLSEQEDLKNIDILYKENNNISNRSPPVKSSLVSDKQQALKKTQQISDKDNSEKECVQHSHLEIEDVNNNNIKISKKHLISSTKRKLNHKKRYSKILDHKKALQNMKLHYSDPDYCIYKYKQLIKNSVARDLRELDVQKAQRELDLGMERWQDRVLLLQWLDTARALEQASRELERKVERLHQKNRSRNIMHTMNINKVKEAEDMKAEGLRRQVEDKKQKILTLQQEKNRIISESKNRALTIQELKEHIRNIETPETFDQKVAKLSMNKKVLDSHMCARIMQKSHIWLG